MYTSLACLALAGLSFAVPVEERQAAAPTATITSGTVVGSNSRGIDSFSAIPYAKPPVGDLRLRAPQAYGAFPGGTFQATTAAASCPQPGFSLDLGGLSSEAASDVRGQLRSTPFGQTAERAEEDCLTITVQRPAGTNAESKLPVAFWIYGGGFEAGGTSMYDGSNIIRRSVALRAPVIYVAVNYRVGGFGFLAGRELGAESSTNLGLRDQRLGLQWVADNIAAFGGDPLKVTIFGESAGAISVADQTIINGGDNTYKGNPLFRGAIMNSGSIIPAEDVSTPKAQNIYDTVVANSPCAGQTNTLACLRGLPYDQFFDAVTSVPGIFSYRSVDLSYLPRPDPSDNFFSQSPEIAISSGRFAKVPVIIGSQEDEGTLFSLVQSNITNNNQLVEYLASYFPTNPNAAADVRGLVAQYPDQVLLGQPAGSPFRNAGLWNIYPQYKRLAAILGDITFTLTRRSYLNLITNQGVPAWSYLATFLFGTPLLGTFHASDVFFGLFADATINKQAQTFQGYYISFFNTLNPNSLGNAAPLINWPQWTNGSTQLVNIELFKNSLTTDDFRSGAYNYIVPKTSNFRV